MDLYRHLTASFQATGLSMPSTASDSKLELVVHNQVCHGELYCAACATVHLTSTFVQFHQLAGRLAALGHLPSTELGVLKQQLRTSTKKEHAAAMVRTLLMWGRVAVDALEQVAVQLIQPGLGNDDTETVLLAQMDSQGVPRPLPCMHTFPQAALMQACREVVDSKCAAFLQVRRGATQHRAGLT